MDDAKKLLDSLMGQTRNVPLKEAKKKKGQNFKEANACKFYLLGFCPQHEQLFRNTKRHLGDCNLIHSEALKSEFEDAPDKEDLERKYVRDLVRYMEGIVRTADEAVSRQARNIQAANKELEERGPNDVAKREIEKIRENCNLLLAEAEELAEAGDIEGSKMKQAIFEQTKEKADDYEAKSKLPIKEEVCEVCGLRPEDGDGMRKFSHTEGKIHIGFMKVREWLKTMRARARELDGNKEKDDDRDDRKRDRRDRDRSDDRDRKDRKDRDDRREKDPEDRKDKEGDEEMKDKDAEPAQAESDVQGAGASGDKEESQDKDQKQGDRDESRRDRDDRRGRRDDRGGRGDDRGGRDDRRGGGDRGDRRGGDRDYRGGDRRGDRDGDRRSGGDRNYDRGGRDRDRGYGNDRRGRSRSRDQRRY